MSVSYAPFPLGIRWTTTGKVGAQNFSRYNALYSFQLSPSILTFILNVWLHIRSSESTSKSGVDVSPPNLEFWAVTLLVGSPCLWSLVYEIWSLNTALSLEVENSELVNLALPDSLEMIPRKLEVIMFQRLRHPWHPTFQDLETELNIEELADA